MLTILCHFDNMTYGGNDQWTRKRISVFGRQNYKPFQGEVSMRLEPLGGEYQITTEFSKNGLPKFLAEVVLLLRTGLRQS